TTEPNFFVIPLSSRAAWLDRDTAGARRWVGGIPFLLDQERRPGLDRAGFHLRDDRVDLRRVLSAGRTDLADPDAAVGDVLLQVGRELAGLQVLDRREHAGIDL